MLLCTLLSVSLINTSASTYAQTLQDVEEVKIGLVPEVHVFEQMKRYEYLTSYLTKKTGIKIRFSIVKNYGDIVDLFYGLELDGAFFGSLTALIADEKLEVEPVVRPVYPDGKSTSRSYILIRKDSRISGIRDLKGKVIAFVDKASTTGYVFLVAYLREKGVNSIGRYFGEYFYTGSHDAAIKSVLEGGADITAVKDRVYQMLAYRNHRVAEELIVIARSAEFPSNTLWLSKHLDREIRERIKKAFLEMSNDKEGREALRRFGAKGFIETGYDDYKNVLILLKRAGIKDLRTYDYFNK
jgi:phosphonate transport system substrate-binding protein